MPAAFTPEVGVVAAVKAVVVAPVLGTALVTLLGTEVTTSWLGMTGITVTPTLTGGEIVAAGCPTDAQGNVAPRQTRGGVVRTKVVFEGEYDGDSYAGASGDVRFVVGSFIKFDVIYNSVTGWGRYANVGRVASQPVTVKYGPDTHKIRVEIDVDGFLTASSAGP